MAGRTGYTPTPAAFDPQVHMDAIYAHFDALTGETRATAASLPASGNWEGREIAAIDTQITYKWFSGSGWVDLLAGTAWAAPSLLNSWVNTSSGFATAGYRKLGKTVTLKGNIKSGTTTSGTVLFILPAEFRPLSIRRFAIISSTVISAIDVDPAGNVKIAIAGASSASIGLEGITFDIDA